MIPRLLLASILAGTLLLTGSPSSARVSGSEEAIEATRHMTISASRSSYVDLRIPSDARLSLNYWSRKKLPTPRFAREDEFAGLVLASQKTIGLTYGAFRLPNEKGVLQREISIGGQKLCNLDAYCEIAAGDYRLFLVTEAPTSVEIELKGLNGSSNLRLTRRMVGEISGATASYTHWLSLGVTEIAAHGAGFSATLTGEHNYIFSSYWFRGSDNPVGPAPVDEPLLQAGVSGACGFNSEAPAEAYAPGCPTGGSDWDLVTLRALDEFGTQYWGTAANIGPGPKAKGFYAWHTGVRDPGFVGFWLDLTS